MLLECNDIFDIVEVRSGIGPISDLATGKFLLFEAD